MEYYNMIGEIGKGVYGTVYICTKKHNNEKLVMKEIKTDLKGEDLKAAQNEVAVLKSLCHPNIILYYDSFAKNDKFYIVMEYANKGTLHDYLNKLENYLDPQAVMNYFCQILMGLNHIHEKKIIHRDLKCENIMLTGRESDIIKIGDFGISKLSTKSKCALTVIGTCNYLAPELCDEKPYDHKVDIWSLGCILYELCCKKRMFDGSLSNIITSITTGKIQSVNVKKYGKQIQEIIEEMLQMDPTKRPDTKTLLCYQDIYPTIYVLQTTLGCILK